MENFNKFVDALLRVSKKQAERGEFHAFSVLHSPELWRFFRPDPDETAYEYAVRLARESEQMKAIWFFNAMVAPGRALDDPGLVPNIDPDDIEAIETALEAGNLVMSLCWYAEGEEGENRSGIIHLTQDGIPTGTEVEGQMDQETNPYKDVMGHR